MFSDQLSSTWAPGQLRNLLPCYVRLLQIFELSEYFGTLLVTVFGMAQDTPLGVRTQSVGVRIQADAVDPPSL